MLPATSRTLVRSANNPFERGTTEAGVYMDASNDGFFHPKNNIDLKKIKFTYKNIHEKSNKPHHLDPLPPKKHTHGDWRTCLGPVTDPRDIQQER